MVGGGPGTGVKRTPIQAPSLLIRDVCLIRDFVALLNLSVSQFSLLITGVILPPGDTYQCVETPCLS